jgi:hypothetical protein
MGKYRIVKHAAGAAGATLCGRARRGVQMAPTGTDMEVSCKACARALLAGRDLEYIRNAYGVPAVAGRRVEFDGRRGVIRGACDGRLVVLLDGDETAGTYHPIWRMIYLRGEG